MQPQAAPTYAPPPADAALQQRIDTLVSYAAKNGACGQPCWLPCLAACSTREMEWRCLVAWLNG